MESTPRAEALLAVTGVTAALRPGPVLINLKVIAKAEGLETRVRRAIRRFVRDPDLAPFEPEGFQDPTELYDEVADLLPRADYEANQVENVSGFEDPILQMEYAEQLGMALGYVKTIFPHEPLGAMVGNANMRPSGLDVADFARKYRVVDNPMEALDDLASGPITPDQVVALETVYPLLYAYARNAILQEMVAAASQKKSYRLPYEKDLALQVFLKTETLDSVMNSELSRIFDEAREKESGQTEEGQPTGGQPGKVTPENKLVATQSQKLDAK